MAVRRAVVSGTAVYLLQIRTQGRVSLRSYLRCGKGRIRGKSFRICSLSHLSHNSFDLRSHGIESVSYAALIRICEKCRESIRPKGLGSPAEGVVLGLGLMATMATVRSLQVSVEKWKGWGDL